MHFSLTNAHRNFMRLMNEILKKLLGKLVIVYWDDIMSFSKSKDKKLLHMRQAS